MSSMSIMRSVFAAAALVAAIAAPPAAADEQFACRFDGSGDSSPAVPSTLEDASTDVETGRLTLSVYGDCLIDRPSDPATAVIAKLDASLDYESTLCGTMRAWGPFWLALPNAETLTGQSQVEFRAGAGSMVVWDVSSNFGFAGGAGNGPAHLRPVVGDCLVRRVDRFGFIGALHIREGVSF